MNDLVLIPARGGSKGIPGKNLKKLNGKPLIYYSIDYAKAFFSDEHICVSTDDMDIKNCVENYPLEVPFLRPAELGTDYAGTQDVLIHALKFYKDRGVDYDNIILLQPTSPFRDFNHLKDMISLMEKNDDLDMVVSVKESKENPYFNLYEEDNFGYLSKSKISNFIRRQDCPNVYAFNGSIYIINIKSLLTSSISNFKKVQKYIMKNPINNVDIDDHEDWIIAEYYLNKNN